jgi:hypothetical protein
VDLLVTRNPPAPEDVLSALLKIFRSAPKTIREVYVSAKGMTSDEWVELAEDDPDFALVELLSIEAGLFWACVAAADRQISSGEDGGISLRYVGPRLKGKGDVREVHYNIGGMTVYLGTVRSKKALPPLGPRQRRGSNLYTASVHLETLNVEPFEDTSYNSKVAGMKTAIIIVLESILRDHVSSGFAFTALTQFPGGSLL